MGLAPKGDNSEANLARLEQIWMAAPIHKSLWKLLDDTVRHFAKDVKIGDGFRIKVRDFPDPYLDLQRFQQVIDAGGVFQWIRQARKEQASCGT